MCLIFAQTLMEAALLECQQACLAKQEEALAAQRAEARQATEAALLEERKTTEELVEELKVKGRQCVHIQ
jgi:hypothetical protein